MASLVLAEHDNRTLCGVTAKTVTAAGQLGQPVHILVAGSDCSKVAEAAAQIAGVETVLLADDSRYAHPLAETFAALILSLASRYDAVLAPATSNGKSILPRVAAMLDVPQISDVTKILPPDTFERPVYAGAAIQTVKALPGRKVITLRTTAFASAAATATLAPIMAIPPADDPGLAEFAGATRSQSDRPELTTAKIVVSAGRGLQTADQFQLLNRIAGRLNAALGASRATVDAGFLPNDCQVGQTGKIVAPELYLAAGISGAIQHLAGIKQAKIIAAINKDEEAPVFAAADFGLVADLAKALPELDAELAKRGYN